MLFRHKEAISTKYIWLILSVAATTTSSRLVVVVVVDFSRVDDRLDYDYRTDYNYDYEIFVVDSRRL
jgi:hypothetical protein